MTSSRAGSTIARRWRALSWGGLAIAGLLAVVSGAQPWWRVDAGDASATFSGTESTGGLAQGLALVILAGLLLSWVLRYRGRQVVAILLLIAALAIIAVAIWNPAPSHTAVINRVRLVSLSDHYALSSQVWAWIYGFGGLLGTAGAVVMVATAHRWPQRASRFERTGPTDLTDADPTALWRALDAGVDPTAEEPRDEPGVGIDGPIKGDSSS